MSILNDPVDRDLNRLTHAILDVRPTWAFTLTATADPAGIGGVREVTITRDGRHAHLGLIVALEQLIASDVTESEIVGAIAAKLIQLSETAVGDGDLTLDWSPQP